MGLMMKNIVFGLAVVLGAQVAFAQAAPSIAYTKVVSMKRSYQRDVYVANADGSNAALVYSTSSLIGDVELSPNHDKVFIIDDKSLRVLSLSVSGSSVTVSGSVMLDDGLSADGIVAFGDWSADGNSILYINNGPGGVSRLKIISALDASVSFNYAIASRNVGIPKFVGADKIAYIDYCSTYCVKLLTLNPDGSVASDTQIYSGGVETIEAARGSETVIISSGNQAKALDVNTQAVSLIHASPTTLQDAVMNADDSALYFRQQSSLKGKVSFQLMKKDLVSGTVSQILSSPDQVRNIDAE
jgi:hypothetical protein